ncbi:retrovirus-related pol polyprotein from transposon TNT 1-94 [Tanacetum coccineum]
MASASPNCLIARATSTKSWLWHQRLSHLKFDTIIDLSKNDLVTGLPKFKYHKEQLCPSYISFLHVFGALCYPKNDCEDTGELGAKGDIGFFIGYSINSCAYKASKHEFWTNQFRTRSYLCSVNNNISKTTKQELDPLFEAMYDDYIGGQPSTTPRTAPAAQAPQVLQTRMTSTTIADTAPTLTNSSPQATVIPITLQDVNELELEQHNVQQQDDQAQLQTETVVDNILNAMFDGNTFVNPFAPPTISATESSYLQYVDPSNMHSDMCIYALNVSTMEPRNVKEAMTDPAWIDLMQEDLL